MKPSRRRLLQSLLIASGAAACSPPRVFVAPTREVGSNTPPPAAQPVVALKSSAHFMRAAWVASVANIDWPSQRGLSAASVRSQIEAIVNTAAALQLNTLIVQVRPAGDALYASSLEPWSEFLTGEQGRPPDEAGFDPLREWITRGREKGIAIHAWFNPYRASHPSGKSAFHGSHISKRLPQAVLKYGDYWWMDPAHPGAREHSLSVILDVVRRYDVAGVHIDDYFYPYPVTAPASNGQSVAVPFPDHESWRAYTARGGTLKQSEWRRSQVDIFVEQLYTRVKQEKPQVLVGISPFGIGKPALRPPGVRGFSQYDELYADVEHWLSQGWLDYLAPQLYWSIASAEQGFEALLQYWISQNPLGRDIIPGLYTSRVGSAESESWALQEIIHQLDIIERTPQARGFIHFSMKPLLENRLGLADALKNRLR